MTTRLYYNDSFLYDFDAEVREVLETPRPGVVLDQTAFYPTSGGQVFDTGWIASDANSKLRVSEVAESEDGKLIHYLEAPVDLKPGTRIRGEIDATRRRDHMQQHSGQHVLSAAFIRLYDIPTVSFHMADDYCSIDLDTPTLTKEQIESVERLANEIILENRSVDIRFVTRVEAGKLGLRKLPPTERDELRLIDIRDFDLTACGGTHVAHTGQIASILLRKTEKVRQGWRLEFVAGQRAVATARRDFTSLTETAALFSANIYDIAATGSQIARRDPIAAQATRAVADRISRGLCLCPACRCTRKPRPQNSRPRAHRPRPQFREAPRAKADSAGTQRSRASGDHFAAAIASLRTISGPAF